MEPGSIHSNCLINISRGCLWISCWHIRGPDRAYSSACPARFSPVAQSHSGDSAKRHLYVALCSTVLQVIRVPCISFSLLRCIPLCSALHGLGETLSLGRDRWALTLSGLKFQPPPTPQEVLVEGMNQTGAWLVTVPWLKVKVTQSRPALCNAIDCTVHGILQARILEWVAFPFSRGSSQPRG